MIHREAEGTAPVPQPGQYQFGNVIYDLPQGWTMGVKIGSDFQILVAYDLDPRFELLAFEGDAYDQAALTEGMAVFSDQISPVFDNLHFVSAGTQSLLPAPVPGGLSGLYWGTSLEQLWGIDLALRFDLVSQSYFFWADGQFYNGTPPDGLRPLNRAALLAAGDVNFGVYRQQGDKIVMTYSTGMKQEFTVSGTSLILDDLTLHLTPPMADGSRIAGTISAFSYSSFTPGAGIEGGMSASSSTTFFKDGTYIGQSFGGGFGTFDLGGGGGGGGGGGFSTGSSDTTGGQYEVRDGLITLTPNDGSAPGSRIIVDTSDGIMIADQFLE